MNLPHLQGTSLIGSTHFPSGDMRSPGSATLFHAIDPTTGSPLDPAYASATPADIDHAVRQAAEAFADYRQASGAHKGAFLRRIAVHLEALAEPIVERAHRETALPVARLASELARTCFQLRLFAELVEEGSWVDARIDQADPERRPVPKPDVRSMLRPLGPVAVFGASNFPLAFSVAGGDTASALAAGCPVIVKAHPAHPGTSELAGLAIQRAVKESGLPEGVFALLFDAGHAVGAELVRHPAVKAVGFTGSRSGGRALVAIAAARPEPIPVYAEMSSINPVFILPGAMQARAEDIATGLHASVTLGVGQFCTNPGLVIVEAGDTTRDFLHALEKRIAATPAGTMLTAEICASYHAGVADFAATHGVQQRLAPSADAETGSGPQIEPGAAQANAALFATDAETFLANPNLMAEVFGPATLMVVCADRAEMTAVARALEGQLTTSIHGTAADLVIYAELLAILETRAGRLVFDGFPTGVEVCHAMVHGGPYPATSDGRSTSVGTRAIQRFARPVCFQDCPDAVLPDALKRGNPLGIRRLVDGRWEAGRSGTQRE
jgi:alpha-ketoglutaric semialdehyde dehydrogenase